MIRHPVLRVLQIAAGSLALAAAPASAQQFSFNLGGASDYVYRGLSQTRGEPQLFGSADLAGGTFYAGAWASNVDFGDSTDAEVDLYAGARPRLGPFALDLGLYAYSYLGAPSGTDYDYLEAHAGASLPLGPARLGAAFAYSPDGFGAADRTAYYELNGWIPAGPKLSLSAAVGRQTLDGVGDYTTWNLGLGYALAPGLGVDLRYHDTAGHRFADIDGARLALSLKATF